MRTVDPAKHGEKRQAILEAAGRCFARDGFRGATIAAICAEAMISPGHLYHYFESKEAIIEAMTQARLEYVSARFSHIMEGPNVVAALLAELDAGPTHCAREAPPLLFDMLTEAGRNPAVGRILREHSHAVRTLLAEVLRTGQGKGQVDPDLDPILTAAVLIGVLDGAKLLAVRDPDVDRIQIKKLLQTLITSLLTAPAA